MKPKINLWQPGQAVTTGLLYTDGLRVCAATADGIPAAFGDPEYFEAL